MRHRISGKKLGRDIDTRKALFKSLIIALIKYGKIKTTVAKAKAIQRIIDKLVTYAKDGSSSAIKQLSSFLVRREPINKLINVITPRLKDKQGGYSRMIRVGKRKGDAVEQAILKWSVEEEKKRVKGTKSKDRKDKKEKQEREHKAK